MSDHRKHAIVYLFMIKYGCPDEKFWKEKNIVTEIMNRLYIPLSSRQLVKNAMNDALISKSNHVSYDSKFNLRKRGSKTLINDLDENSYCIYSALSAGLTVSQTTTLLNEYRIANGFLNHVSVPTVERFLQRSDVINRSRRMSEKSGKTDEKSIWAQARVAQSAQFLRQLYGIQ